MSKPAELHGSQRHLLDWLVHSPAELTAAVARRSEPEVALRTVEWIDVPGAKLGTPFEREWRGVDFLLAERPQVVHEYRSVFWPRTGNVPNWDAVGRISSSSGAQWLLVEAKGHLRELDQACAAKSAEQGGSRPQIARRLDELKALLSPGNANDWLAHYYQFANRLAALWFLLARDVDARLLHIFFTGDSHFADGPRSAAQWRDGFNGIPGYAEMDRWFGRPFAHPIEDRLHVLCLPADPGIRPPDVACP